MYIFGKMDKISFTSSVFHFNFLIFWKVAEVCFSTIMLYILLILLLNVFLNYANRCKIYQKFQQQYFQPHSNFQVNFTNSAYFNFQYPFQLIYPHLVTHSSAYSFKILPLNLHITKSISANGNRPTCTFIISISVQSKL